MNSSGLELPGTARLRTQRRPHRSDGATQRATLHIRSGEVSDGQLCRSRRPQQCQRPSASLSHVCRRSGRMRCRASTWLRRPSLEARERLAGPSLRVFTRASCADGLWFGQSIRYRRRSFPMIPFRTTGAISHRVTVSERMPIRSFIVRAHRSRHRFPGPASSSSLTRRLRQPARIVSTSARCGTMPSAAPWCNNRLHAPNSSLNWSGNGWYAPLPAYFATFPPH